jgi:IS5 family transposase
MGVAQNEQMTIGEVDIANIRFAPKSRDDIPKILRGLQFIYTHVPLRTSIFELLGAKINPLISKTNDRPGMTLWNILVWGVILLDLNCDYDRLHELVNHHNTLREMLGHAPFDEETYHFQTLKDNVSLLTPELLDEINQVVVAAGHVLVNRAKDVPVKALKVRLQVWQRYRCNPLTSPLGARISIPRILRRAYF